MLSRTHHIPHAGLEWNNSNPRYISVWQDSHGHLKSAFVLCHNLVHILFALLNTFILSLLQQGFCVFRFVWHGAGGKWSTEYIIIYSVPNPISGVVFTRGTTDRGS